MQELSMPRSIRSRKSAGGIENRKHKRIKLHYPAWVDAGAGVPLCNCMLWDMSETGGRLTIEKPFDIPEQFVLVLSKDGDHGRHCQTIWRKDMELGFKILGLMERA
jgi:hypothetical protein